MIHFRPWNECDIPVKFTERAQGMSGEEAAFCRTCGCGIFRFFDGEEYVFSYPEPENEVENGNGDGALSELEEYARRQEIPLTLLDVPREKSEEIKRRYRFCRVEAEDEDGDFYAVRVVTEAEMLKKIPTVCGERLRMNRLKPSDADAYFALCNDENAPNYWGYQAAEDFPKDAGGRDYLSAAEEEFARGVSIPFAVRLKKQFIGEVVFYAFDGRGRAEIALRLLPEFRGKGYGTEVLEMSMAFAQNLGLTELDAWIEAENAPSLALFAKRMEKVPNPPNLPAGFSRDARLFRANFAEKMRSNKP